MKKGMCKGCSNLIDQVIQIQHYDDNGNPLDPPLEVLNPYCTHYKLHIGSVDRIHKGVQKCPWYYDVHFHE